MATEYITCPICFNPTKIDKPICSCERQEVFPAETLSKYGLQSPEEYLAEAGSIEEAETKRATEAEEVRIEEAINRGDWVNVPNKIIAARTGNIILTTAFSLPKDANYEVIEIVTAECVYGMNIFRDIMAGVRDIVGGRSGAAQKVLRDARKTCLTELRREALLVKADAVIGVNLNYSEISGAGLLKATSTMLFLVATGTAVKITG